MRQNNKDKSKYAPKSDMKEQSLFPDKIIIGLTGGSGSGKSTLGRASAGDDILYIDADKLGQQVILKGQPAYRELIDAFGISILKDDGEIDRKKLGAAVFSDKEKLLILNQISHRCIKEKITQMIKATDKKGIIIDGAVIIGSQVQPLCDIIVSVLADKNVRMERITARDNISCEEAQRRIKNQPDDEFYIKNSDYIIYNNGQTDEAINEATAIFRRIIG